MEVHSVAQAGFRTGTNDLYNRARPSYQPGVFNYIRENIRGSSPLNVVEIGAGTGIFTRAFLDQPWSSEIKYIKAIDPSHGMREVFSKTVSSDHVIISISEGTFDTTGIEDQWGDLIVIAQAFHWCPDYDRACTEFARILKPNGVVAFIWNLEDRDEARWVAQLLDRIERHEQGTPQFRLHLWRQTFDTTSYKKFFLPQVEKIWTYTLETTLEKTIDRAFSNSYLVLLPEDVKAEIRKDAAGIIGNGEDKVWIDEQKGTFEYPYKSYVVIAHKR
ncbi:S-adenosyl-L-methionine-dependent methyltransferase [Tricholoma matsutake]|nr:S-adenosyl-L-methionine-dependent methyltransferase [Tricholoma matsutake 945]